ncbi:unnamed protein product [Cylicocyclus nassatus]|uniref:RING-type domain-containing protein n=1 Tax=Cylicocyclus nassatus TaxID=53992 RepID=A0AA36H0T9_CYLNA|nr:unnamed protein product [Cylicocyclus nassatus]
MPNTTPSSYTGLIEWTSTQSSKTRKRESSRASGKTVDEVGEEMPEMQLCDGVCGQMVFVEKMTKLPCAHIFCHICLPEGQRTHAKCTPPPTKTIIKLANSIQGTQRWSSSLRSLPKRFFKKFVQNLAI